MINTAIADGPLSLPDAVAMLDSAYLGHVIVLWSWALKQPIQTDSRTSIRIGHRPLPVAGRTRP